KDYIILVTREGPQFGLRSVLLQYVQAILKPDGDWQRSYFRRWDRLRIMKRCPECQLAYPDDTLNFCRNDGTALVSSSGDSGQTLILPSRTTNESAQIRTTGPTVTTSSLSAPARRKVSRRIINSLAVLPLL